MGEWLHLSEVDMYIYQVLLIDLAIAVLMISALRLIAGLVANVNSTEELSSHDNFAFGIAMSAGVISLALMLTGAVSGEPGQTYLAEVTNVLSYGVLGLVLIRFGRLCQDKLLLTGIEILQEIKRGNIAAALVDAANTIATGLILRAVMLWVESDALNGLLVVLGAFLLVQLLMAGVSKYRMWVYSRRHPGESLQLAFKAQKTALAIRFLGHLIGVALAITAASGVVAYDPGNLVFALGLWALLSLIFAVLVSLLAVIARSIILFNIDVVAEVDRQNNVGVAAIEAAIYIAIGLFFTTLFA